VAARAAEKARLVAQNRELVEQLQRANEELQEANDALKEMAVRDGLTSLYNHRYFQEALTRELSRSRRYQKECSVIFMDVDHFKTYNDTHGHPEGDSLLKRLSDILMDHVRSSDLAARYGGEEFVLLLPETTKDSALRMAETLREKVELEPFRGREQQPLGKVTISVGVATFPADGADPPSVMAFADQLLYKAKHGGRNMVVCSQ
jgi:two-component system, cell cycle response regulator